MAGPHSMVNASRSSEARNRPTRVSTNGRATMTRARPTSHVTMVRLRSHRSTSTPATGPKKNPGTIRAASTRLSAAPSFPEPNRMARMAMASKPSQSPVADTTWASHNRKKAGVPNRRARSARRPPTGRNGARSSPDAGLSRRLAASRPVDPLTPPL